MANVTIYLFETKSIQSYLSRTGQLKDMITISDKLVDLIDTNSNSWVFKILSKCNIKNNLVDMENGVTAQSTSYAMDGITFFRCKGGSFYCFSYDASVIEKFRSAWTLFFQMGFPGMSFTDISKEVNENEFTSKLGDVFKSLAASFNYTSPFLPYATSVCQSTSVTGQAAVLDDLKNKLERNIDLAQDRFSSSRENISKVLYKKFLGPEHRDEVVDYLDAFKQYQNGNDNDIALIHLDGNGIGQTLDTLRKKYEKASINEYIENMVSFSGILGKITEEAVTEALGDVISALPKNDTEGSAVKNKLVFRPLILGGDDVTVLIDAKYAMDFCTNLANKFKNKSHKQLKDFGVKYLTLSGGVLFNKINHPYNNSAAIIESLAEMAKKLTKKNWDPSSNHAGPAAIAFFRMSTTTTEGIEDVITRSRVHLVRDEGELKQFTTGSACYYLDAGDDIGDANNYYNLSLLLSFVNKLDHSLESKIHGRLRRMLTSITQGDLREAQMIFERMKDIDPKAKKCIESLFGEDSFYKITSEGKYQSIIDDILVLYHYIKAKK